MNKNRHETVYCRYRLKYTVKLNIKLSASHVVLTVNVKKTFTVTDKLPSTIFGKCIYSVGKQSHMNK